MNATLSTRAPAGRRPAADIAPVTPVALTPAQRAIVHMAASLLLDYPAEESFSTRVEAVTQALTDLGDDADARQVAGLLERFLAVARKRGQRALAEHYVETFDQRRRCCLYLSYYAVGDTRHRGTAIVAFKEALAAAGFELAADELPDFLPVVLELSAKSDGDEIADVLLGAHRDGIEVLRTALVACGSPYAWLVEAVCMTLPAIDEATAQRVRALVSAGPPTETVGVTDVLPFPTTPVRYPAVSQTGSVASAAAVSGGEATSAVVPTVQEVCS